MTTLTLSAISKLREFEERVAKYPNLPDNRREQERKALDQLERELGLPSGGWREQVNGHAGSRRESDSERERRERRLAQLPDLEAEATALLARHAEAAAKIAEAEREIAIVEPGIVRTVQRYNDIARENNLAVLRAPQHLAHRV